MHLNEQPNLAPIRPQNLSCPAGGTDTAQRGQRGVIVAPPSPNTSQHDPLVLHRGFDTLALSVKATLPKEAYDHFMVAKTEAEETRTDILTQYQGVQLHIKAYGGKGYALIADGGPMGATWFFKKPNAKDPWGVRVSFGSDFLACQGLGNAKAHLETVMERLGMSHTEADISIGRADYCVDILTPDFILVPDNFTMLSRMKRKDHLETFDMSVHGTSGKVSSVTVGSVTNRQAIIYDKRAEVIARNKHQWWVIWQDCLDRIFQVGQIAEHIKLDPSDPLQSRVTRIEFRAGKTALKGRWSITTWADFFDRFGDLCRQMGEDICYCDPNPKDTNRARWPKHLLWEIACSEMNDDLFEMRSGVQPDAIKEVHKATHISMLLRNITGCAITHAALNGMKIDEMPAHLGNLAQEITANLAKRPDKTRKQLEAAKAKYVFITGPEKV